MKPKSVYLDHAATTPLDPSVLEAMMPYLGGYYGNASSVHGPGRRARGAIEEARERIADLLGAETSEIVFTSGGTESNNLALRGCATEGWNLVTSPLEHEAVLEPAEWMASHGRTLSFTSVQSDGTVRSRDLADTLDGLESRKTLVSLMHVNNEIGAVNDVRALARVAHERGAVVHTDAVQSAALLRGDVAELGVDLLSLSAHKLYGPKGIGALYVRSGVVLEGLLRGGEQERGRRAGTENVAGIVGLARAMEIAAENRAEWRERIGALRERLKDALQEVLGDQIVMNGVTDGEAAAPHIVSVSVRSEEGESVDAEMLLLGLDMEGVHASSGSACSSGTMRPSHVLEAIGRSPAEARAAIRFSLGKDTTAEHVDYAVNALERVLRRLRAAG